MQPKRGKIQIHAVWLIIAESGFLAAKDTLNWIQGVKDERVECQPGLVLSASAVLLGSVGHLILTVGVFLGL